MGNIVLVVILFFMANLIGVTVFSYYAKLRCDPVFSGMLNSPNKVTQIKTSTTHSNQKQNYHGNTGWARH